ncbi:hypothetical protein ACQKJC_11685 [Priestia koreensis]|uniref:hypothetical protein n=1 Tax=Priestia koreensis TaxID=284581 RepID=UPI003D08C85D
MNIYEALEQLPNEKKMYFTWKHDLRFKRNEPRKTKENFLKEVNRKTLDGFVKWERTTEYKNLLTLLLESKIANDLEEIYSIVSKKAREGDEKSITLFFKLQKEIQLNAKLITQSMESSEVEEDDELEI